MNHVIVLKCPYYLDDSIAGADVAQELIAQAFAFARSGNQAGNVHKGHSCRDDLVGFIQLAKFLQPLVGHRHNTRIRLDGRKRIVGGQYIAACQGIEKGRFAYIGQADDAAGDITHRC